MKFHFIDILIIFAYLASTVFIGFLVKKRASKNLDSYFLVGIALVTSYFLKKNWLDKLEEE